MYNAESVAAYFVSKSTHKLENMAINKLVYIAHGWNLASTGKPLFKDNVEAYRYGPIIPSIYYTWLLSGFRGKTVNYRMLDKFDDYTIALLDRILEIYNIYNKHQLSGLCNDKDSLWYQFTKDKQITDSYREVIPNNIIKEYYDKLFIERRKAKNVEVLEKEGTDSTR